MKKIIFFLLFLTVSKTNCQVKQSEPTSKWKFEDFSYPIFLENEKHTFFKISYLLNDNLQMEFKNHFDTYTLENRIRTSIGLKQYISDKIYFNSGIEMEFSRDNSKNRWNTQPRTSINAIFGYDVKSNFLLEAKGNFQLNETNWGPNGQPLIPMKKVYSFGGNLKF